MLRLLELGDDLGAEQLDGAHDRLVAQVAELHVADELVHAELGVLHHLLDARLGVAHDDHVGLGEPLGVELALDLALEEGEHLLLLLVGEMRHLPLQDELGQVLVPPPHRVPDAVGLGLLHGVGAVHERVRGHLVGRHLGERRRGSWPPSRYWRMCSAIFGDGLHDRERQQPHAQLARHRRRSVGGRRHPGGRVGNLHRLGRHHAAGEVEVLAVELEVLLAPRLHGGLDGLLPLGPALLHRHVEGGLLHRGGAARPPLHAPPGEDVGGGDLLGHVHGMAELVRHEHDAEAEAQVLGGLGQRADDHLGGGRVRPALAEVVLDVPHGVEAERVGQLDLLERLGVGLLLGLALAPGVLPPATAWARRSRTAGRASRSTPMSPLRSISRTPDPNTERLPGKHRDGGLGRQGSRAGAGPPEPRR